MGEIGEWSKEMKTQKKQHEAQRIAEGHPTKRRCYDWMLVGGNTHYAMNRSSFKTYCRIGCKINNVFSGVEHFVAGIGDVELSVHSSPNAGAPARTITLKNVLHLPRAISNGMSTLVWMKDVGEVVGKVTLDSASDRYGQPWWYGKPFIGLSKLALAGNPQGESYLTEKGPKMLSLQVPMDFYEKYLGENKTGGIDKANERDHSPGIESVDSDDVDVPTRAFRGPNLIGGPMIVSSPYILGKIGFMTSQGEILPLVD
ncbi:hypothetical protein BJX65DRAFT_314473 [Aspergillus insuetus]